MSGGRSERLLPVHELCVARYARNGWSPMSRSASESSGHCCTSAGALSCKMWEKWCSSIKAFLAFLATRPSCIWGSFLKKNTSLGILTTRWNKHLLNIVVWTCMAYSGVGHRLWNCQCDQVGPTPSYCRSPWCHQHSCYFSISSVSRMTVSICYLAKLVTNWRCLKNTKTLTLPAQSL